MRAATRGSGLHQYGAVGDDLIAVRSPSDGKMDKVYTLRTQYNVDLVSLFVTRTGAGP